MDIIKPRPLQLNAVEARYNNLHEVFLFVDAFSEVKKFEVVRNDENDSRMVTIEFRAVRFKPIQFEVINREGYGYAHYLVILNDEHIRHFDALDYHLLFMVDKPRPLIYNDTDDGLTLEQQKIEWAERNSIYTQKLPDAKQVSSENHYFGGDNK